MICKYCNYKYEVFDENGIMEYCPQRDIYCDEMEGVKECDDLSPLEKIVEICEWKEFFEKSKKVEGIGVTKNHDDCYTCEGFNDECVHYTILNEGSK